MCNNGAKSRLFFKVVYFTHHPVLWKKRLSVDILSCPIPYVPTHHLPIILLHTGLLPEISTIVCLAETPLCVLYVCVYCMWAGGVCQSGYPIRFSKTFMGNFLYGPNPSLSLSFQQISLFLVPFMKQEIVTDGTLSDFILQAPSCLFFWPSLLELHFAYKCTAEPIRGFLCNLRVGKMFPLPPTVVSKV